MTPEMEAIVARCRAKLEALGLRADEVPEDVVAACVEDPDPLATAIGRAFIGLATWEPPPPHRRFDPIVDARLGPAGVDFAVRICGAEEVAPTRITILSRPADPTSLVSQRDPAGYVGGLLRDRYFELVSQEAQQREIWGDRWPGPAPTGASNSPLTDGPPPPPASPGPGGSPSIAGRRPPR